MVKSIYGPIRGGFGFVEDTLGRKVIRRLRRKTRWKRSKGK